MKEACILFCLTFGNKASAFHLILTLVYITVFISTVIELWRLMPIFPVFNVLLIRY